MKYATRILLGFLVLTSSSISNAQEAPKVEIKDIVQLKGNLFMTGEFSNYTAEYNEIPANFGYLSSDQQITIKGIPFQGNLFLSSYQSSILNRYSFSYDSRALKQAIRERVAERISALQEIPSIEAMQQKIENLKDPSQYGQLRDLNEQMKDGSLTSKVNPLAMDSDLEALLRSQQQLSRYNPGEYAQYEQYLQLKSLDKEIDYNKQLKMLEGEGIISSSEKIWYQFDALEIGTARPYFSDLNLGGVPIKGYYAAFSNPYFYLAATEGTTLPFSVQDSIKSFSRNLKAYKLGAGAVHTTHLHFSYLHGEDKLDPTLSSQESNTVGGIDGRLQLFERKLDIQVRSYIGVHTTDLGAQDELFTIDAEDITDVKVLGDILLKNNSLNSSTTSGNAHYISAKYVDSHLKIGGEFRRVDPNYHSMGLAYLRKDLQRTALSIEKSLFNNKLRISANARMDEDNLNGAKDYSATNINGLLRIHSYFAKLPYISLTYMPNFFNSANNDNSQPLSHETHMLSVASSKSYRFMQLNQMTWASVTYNFYDVNSGNFSSINTSLKQMMIINAKMQATLLLISRNTNSSYYWNARASVQYRFGKIGVVNLSQRYGVDYLQNTRSAFDLGVNLSINKHISFGLSATQNYYSQTNRLNDVRVRTSLKASW